MGEKDEGVIKRFLMKRCLPWVLKIARVAYMPLIFVLACFGFVICLYIIDQIMPYFNTFPHNRSGDAWFSVLGCLLPSVASILLSISAIRQTRKINELDKKMHRPALAFQEAKIIAWNLNLGDYKKCSLYGNMLAPQQDAVQTYFKGHEGEPYFCLLKIELNMLLKNEISVDKIGIKDFKFIIRKKEYLFSRTEIIENNSFELKKLEDLKRKFESGFEIYSLGWMLISFKPADAEVWQELSHAIKNDEFLNPEYEEFYLELDMEIKFGLDGERSEPLKAKMLFCSEEGYSRIEAAVISVSTTHGRLVYC